MAQETQHRDVIDVAATCLTVAVIGGLLAVGLESCSSPAADHPLSDATPKNVRVDPRDDAVKAQRRSFQSYLKGCGHYCDAPSAPSSSPAHTAQATHRKAKTRSGKVKRCHTVNVHAYTFTNSHGTVVHVGAYQRHVGC